MDILDKIGMISESGIRDMRDLARQFKQAKIFFHKDLDGVTSAIAIKKYVEDYGIKVIESEPIQYGGEEFEVRKTKQGIMNILVDFAHGKTIMNIHLDHHDNQVGFDKATTSVKFDKTPSNVQAISQTISPTDIFPSRDIQVISTVDSADFAKYNLTPDDIIRATFTLDNKIPVEKNHQMMGFVVNKLLLTYKNKDEFLSSVVMLSKPSLISMFGVIVKLAKSEGYKAPESIDAESEKYFQQRVSKIKQITPSSISTLANGESGMIGTTIVQSGAGYLGKGNQYDRYTIFKAHPEAEYLITKWPLGMVQLSKNPFVSRKNPYHLGDLAQKVLSKFKGDLEKVEITLDKIKYMFERDISKKEIQDAMGFTWKDFEALFLSKAKIYGDEKIKDIIKDVSNKPYNSLTNDQKEVMKKVVITGWDMIQASSGGHRDITNISGLNFLNNTKLFMNDFTAELAKEMQNKHLE